MLLKLHAEVLVITARRISRSWSKGIIYIQEQDGQFSDVPLTYKDISDIKAVFRKRISNIYHVRIAYPERIFLAHINNFSILVLFRRKDKHVRNRNHFKIIFPHDKGY